MQTFESRSDPPDDHLICKVLAGNRDVYAQLVRRYESQVHAVAWAILRNHEAAEDATQETFIKAYDKLATLRTGNRFGPWVLTIARRAATDIARNRKRLVIVPSLLETPGIDAPEDDPADEEDAAKILSALASIPDREQQLILLRYFDGLAVADIAAILGCPVGTVTKQLSRALTRLRSRLTEKP